MRMHRKRALLLLLLQHVGIDCSLLDGLLLFAVRTTKRRRWRSAAESACTDYERHTASATTCATGKKSTPVWTMNYSN